MTFHVSFLFIPDASITSLFVFNDASLVLWWNHSSPSLPNNLFWSHHCSWYPYMMIPCYQKPEKTSCCWWFLSKASEFIFCVGWCFFLSFVRTVQFPQFSSILLNNIVIFLFVRTSHILSWFVYDSTPARFIFGSVRLDGLFQWCDIFNNFVNKIFGGL